MFSQEANNNDTKMTFVLAADLAKAREAGKDFSKQ